MKLRIGAFDKKVGPRSVCLAVSFSSKQWGIIFPHAIVRILTVVLKTKPAQPTMRNCSWKRGLGSLATNV